AGQNAERVSRATCCEAIAVRRATEICGLFFSAICSASLIVRVLAADVPTELGTVCAGYCGAAGEEEPEGDCDGAAAEVSSTFVGAVPVCATGADGNPSESALYLV